MFSSTIHVEVILVNGVRGSQVSVFSLCISSWLVPLSKRLSFLRYSNINFFLRLRFLCLSPDSDRGWRGHQNRAISAPCGTHPARTFDWRLPMVNWDLLRTALRSEALPTRSSFLLSWLSDLHRGLEVLPAASLFVFHRHLPQSTSCLSNPVLASASWADPRVRERVILQCRGDTGLG